MKNVIMLVIIVVSFFTTPFTASATEILFGRRLYNALCESQGFSKADAQKVDVFNAPKKEKVEYDGWIEIGKDWSLANYSYKKVDRNTFLLKCEVQSEMGYEGASVWLIKKYGEQISVTAVLGLVDYVDSIVISKKIITRPVPN